VKNKLRRLWFKSNKKIKGLTSPDGILIAPYISYANDKEVIIRGRVIEDENIVVKEDDGRWDNFINNIKRLESDELAEEELQLIFQNQKYSCRTDEEGYFKLQIQAEIKHEEKQQFLESELNLVHHKSASAVTQILVASNQAKFAVITDIDDTILESHVDSFLKLRLLYETLFKNSYSRRPFKGIGEVLNQVIRDHHGSIVNPIFYVSHSPWNFYDLLSQFMERNNIPMGPFFLRDFGLKRGDKKSAFQRHKHNSISDLLTFYPNIPFVLIGDATEHDLDIYLEIYKKYPNRIAKIIIRSTERKEKTKRVLKLQRQFPKAPIALIDKAEEILALLKNI